MHKPGIIITVAALLSLACTGGAEHRAGRLQRIVVERPERGESFVSYVLAAEEARGDEELELELGNRDDWRALETGTWLGVTGASVPTTADGRPRFVVDHLEVTRVEESASALVVDPANPPAPRRVAVVLFNFQNDDRQPLSVADARRKIFTDANSVRAFHKEQSFGFIDLVGKVDRANGDVFGWYTLPVNNRPCVEGKWDDMALAMVAQQGVDTAGYDHYVFIFPYTDACVYGGRGEQPGKNTWINGGSIRTMNHELGHNFGTPHASSWTCTNSTGERVSFGGPCRTTEYGNPFDVMGHGYRHTNAINKTRARWMGGKNVEEVAKAGIYTLLPQEQPSNGVQLLSTVPFENGAFYVEYRQPFGYDDFAPESAPANGVMILFGFAGRPLTNTFLLDMNPATTTFADAPLGVGKTFAPPGGGVKITLVDRTPQAARVRFEFPNGEPTVNDRDGGSEAGAGDGGSDASLDLAPDGLAPASSPPATGGSGGGGTGGNPGARGGSSGAGGRPTGTGGTPAAPVESAPPAGGGCSCTVGDSGSGSSPGALVLAATFALGLALRRRRRGRSSSLPLLGLLFVFAFSANGCETKASRLGLAPAVEREPGQGGQGGKNGRGGQSGSGGQNSPASPGGQTGQGGQGQTPAGGAGGSSAPDAPAASNNDASGDAAALMPPDGGTGIVFTISAAPPDVAAACARYAEVYCQRLDECMPDGVRRNFGDLTFCRARRDQTCRLDLLTPSRTEAPPRRLGCAEALARQSCRDFMFSRPLAACEYPAGTMKAGEACHRASQCAAGLSCEIEIDESCGTCQPTLGLGDDCSFWSGGCPQGAACYADQCLMPLALGAACKRTAAACLGGMACTDAGCVEKQGNVGTDCRRADVCDSLKNLFCDLATGTCAPLPAPVEVGKPCGVVDATGAASRCGEGASCFAPPASPTRRICVARLPAGSACDTATGPLCAPPAECSRGRCQVPRIVMGGPPTFNQCR